MRGEIGGRVIRISATADDEAPAQITESPIADPSIEGERKMVTALFADIKGSTELMANLDPEEARAIIDPALRIMVRAVRSYEGYVVHSTGDGILRYSARRSLTRTIRSAGSMRRSRCRRNCASMPTRLAKLGKPTIEVRIGINSGEVVMRAVETGGRLEYPRSGTRPILPLGCRRWPPPVRSL